VKKSTIQSVLIKRRQGKKVANLGKIKAWIRRQGWKAGVDVTPNYYRFRQQPPRRFRRFRTVTPPRHHGLLKFVVGFK
jgi:hypothetical protein